MRSIRAVSQALRTRSTTTLQTPRILNTRVPHNIHLPTRAMSDSTNFVNQATPQNSQGQEASESNKTPLPLPAPTAEDGVTQVNVGGQAVKLDHMGPLVVNKDGTLSRISNWNEMADIEKQNTLRILVKRNQLRTEALKEQQGGEGGGA
ncbi:hypothetical protein B0T12DRAFT_409667 [Alternaria alternata]|jgi:hypothetical protein|nr:hypothetical protein B0T12DRAFT_409667 [Alternaria alternata]